MTPFDILSLSPKNKEEVFQFADYFREELEGGRLDPLKALMMCKSMESAIDEVKSVVKQEAINEAAKYGKGQHEIGNFLFSVSETGVKYAYEETGDPLWKRLKADLKDREELLKKLKGTILVVDEETGEEKMVHGAAKSSTTTVKIEMK